MKNRFSETISCKMFETNSSFHLTQRTKEKVEFLFLKSFVAELTKYFSWQDDWTLGYDSMKFRHFPDIS